MKATPKPSSAYATAECDGCTGEIRATVDNENPARLFAWYHATNGKETCDA